MGWVSSLQDFSGLLPQREHLEPGLPQQELVSTCLPCELALFPQIVHLKSFIVTLSLSNTFSTANSSVFPSDTGLLGRRDPVAQCLGRFPAHSRRLHSFIQHLPGSCAGDWGCESQTLTSDGCTPRLKPHIPGVKS